MLLFQRTPLFELGTISDTSEAPQHLCQNIQIFFCALEEVGACGLYARGNMAIKGGRGNFPWLNK